MIRHCRYLIGAWALIPLALGLAGCAGMDPTVTPADPTSVIASPRPAPNPLAGATPIRETPLISSADLARRYDQLEAQLIGEGRLREDAGSLDDLDAADLATNFIRIALFDEYTPVNGQLVAQESSSRLRRWNAPVRLSIRFGASVSPQDRTTDLELTRELIADLGNVTGHPIRMVEGRGNFTVFVVNETERLSLGPYLRREVPGITDPVIESMLDLLPSTFCLVVAFSSPDAPQTYIHAISIIRAEHPPVLRRACFHEEIAQGMGLPNDSPQARPSVFNDDEEFALLTVQDRLMLRMLYDPRLSPGMDIMEAEPIVQTIAAELLPDQDEEIAFINGALPNIH